MNSKRFSIIGLIIIVLVVAGVYLLQERGQDGEFGRQLSSLFGLSEWEEIESADLYFSDLPESSFPEIELGLDSEMESMDFSLGDLDFDFSTEDYSPEISDDLFGDFSFNLPAIDFGQANAGDQSQGWTPNSSDCALFASAPNCSYFSGNQKDMCEECQAEGYF
jgi:hypothetical protein